MLGAAGFELTTQSRLPQTWRLACPWPPVPGCPSPALQWPPVLPEHASTDDREVEDKDRLVFADMGLMTFGGCYRGAGALAALDGSEDGVPAEVRHAVW